MAQLLDRTGEAAIMNSGLRATIIRYGSAIDIDVEFENGAIAYNKKYANFQSGKISCPMLVERFDGYCLLTNPNMHQSFLIDEDDLERTLSCGLWGIKNGYVSRLSKGIRLHRFLLDAPKDFFVDHINGDTLDNRKANLRLCNNQQNGCNSKLRSNNTSGYKGVHFSKKENKWISAIMCNRKHYRQGCFHSKKEAALAYNKAAVKYHGEFARINDVGA